MTLPHDCCLPARRRRRRSVWVGGCSCRRLERAARDHSSPPHDAGTKSETQLLDKSREVSVCWSHFAGLTLTDHVACVGETRETRLPVTVSNNFNCGCLAGGGHTWLKNFAGVVLPSRALALYSRYEVLVDFMVRDTGLHRVCTLRERVERSCRMNRC